MGQDTLLYRGMEDEGDLYLTSTIVAFPITGNEEAWLAIVKTKMADYDIPWECERIQREMHDTPFRGMTLEGYSFSVEESSVSVLDFILKMAHWPNMVVHVSHEEN